MTTRLILIRHGLTDWNLRRKYCSFTDVDINNNGKKQAKLLYRRLKREKIDKVYSSDRKRAFNFARIALRGHKIKKLAELREFNFGIFEGLTYEKLIRRYPKIYKKWLNNPFSITIPDGENLNDFKERIKKILKKLIFLNKGKTIAVVSHAGPIKIFINGILNTNDFWKKIFPAASLNILEYEDGKIKVRLLNNTSYLNG